MCSFYGLRGTYMLCFGTERRKSVTWEYVFARMDVADIVWAVVAISNISSMAKQFSSAGGCWLVLRIDNVFVQNFFVFER